MEGRKGKCTECAEVFVIKPIPKAKAPKEAFSRPQSTPIGKGKASTTATSPPLKSIPPKSTIAASRPRVDDDDIFGGEEFDLPASPPSNAENNIWDSLNLPAASRSEVLASNYGDENPYAITMKPAKKAQAAKSLSAVRPRHEIISLAYWHRALITSFLATLGLCLVGVLAMLILGMSGFDAKANPIAGNVFMIVAILFIVAVLVFVVRFYIALFVLAFKTLGTGYGILFLIGFFVLGSIPLVNIILLIVLLTLSGKILQNARLQVGFLGVDPYELQKL